jgi:hypothetical protein
MATGGCKTSYKIASSLCSFSLKINCHTYIKKTSLLISHCTHVSTVNGIHHVMYTDQPCMYNL